MSGAMSSQPVLGVSLATVAIGVVLVQPSGALAASFNGWDYAIGATDNGVTNSRVGGGAFEIYGLGIKDTGRELIVALNSNLPLTGQQGVTYGDLFFNFTGRSFKAASDLNQLWGVRFTGIESESGATTIGLYSHVRAKNVTRFNTGFANLAQYRSVVQGNDRWGDITTADPYFAGQQAGDWTVLNAIGAGTKTAEISLLTVADLVTKGLDFNQFDRVAGQQTIGFRFEKPSQFGTGRYIASLLQECANDGIVLQSETVPEPLSLAGIGIAGVGLNWLKRKLKKHVPSAQP
jgi:hypothetical protein